MFTIDYLIGFSTILLSGIIQGITGFGFALIAVPLLSIFILPIEVVPIVVIFSFITNILMLYKTIRNIRIREIRLLIISGITGIPAGAYLLNILEPNTIRLIAGFIIMATSVALIKGFTINFKNNEISSIADLT